MHIFAAILRPFGPWPKNFNTLDLSSAYIPVKFCPDPLMFAGDIRDK